MYMSTVQKAKKLQARLSKKVITKDVLPKKIKKL